MKFVCIVNPVSGKGKSRRVAQQLIAELTKRGHDATMLETLPDKEAFRKRCQRIGPEDRVICIGGDGTLLQFINCAEVFHGVSFYGLGTANVVSIEFDMPRKLDKFVDMLEADKRATIKPGMLDDGTIFLMMASAGLDAYVIPRVSQRLKNRLGKPAFGWATIRALFSYKYPMFDLTLDNQTHIQGVWVLISRFKHYGGSFTPCPEADPSSDYLEIIVLKKGGFWRKLMFLMRMATNQLAHSKNVIRTRAHAIDFRVNQIPWQLDGDFFEGQPSRFTVREEPFSLIIP